LEKPGLHSKTNASLPMGMERRSPARNVLELDSQLAYACHFRRGESPMNRKCLLEISVESLEAALAAERGGADRIELCQKLSVGGVTPSVDLVNAVRAHVHVPIFVMIRPRAGDFVYSAAEFVEMKRSIADAKQSGVEGVVLGILRKDRQIDLRRTRELVHLAGPVPVTFHRAFDEATDLRQALEEVIQAGAHRILTSGGAKSAPQGAAVLAELVAASGDRVVLVPGAGINASNVLQLAHQTGAREFHSGLSTALPYGSGNYRKFEEEVRQLAEAISRTSDQEKKADGQEVRRRVEGLGSE
jgi:copper homeostasis protein